MSTQRRPKTPHSRPPTAPAPVATPPARPRATPAPVPAPPGSLDQLETVLRELLAEHERMLTLTTEHRRAISEADIGALRRCMAGQAEIAANISTLERKRQAIVAGLTGQRPPGAAHPGGAMGSAGAPRVTMTTLAKAAPEPVRSRLLSVSDALRDLLNRLHREHQALRQAAETLSSHMEGVMRQVCRTLSHAGTYARSGAIDSSVQVVAALDVRT